MNSKNHATYSAFNLLSLIAIVFVSYILKPLIMPILYASILAIMIFPIQKFLEKKWRCHRLFASLCSITIIFCVTALLGIIVYFQLNALIDNSEIYIAKLTTLYYNFIEYTYDTFGISRRSSLFTKDLRIESLLKGRFDEIGGLIYQSGFLFSYFVLIPIYLFFFLYYRHFFKVFYYKLFRNRPKVFLNRMIRKVYKIQQNYLLGLLKVIIIVGCLNSIGLLFLGIGNPFFFGLNTLTKCCFPSAFILANAALRAALEMIAPYLSCVRSDFVNPPVVFIAVP